MPIKPGDRFGPYETVSPLGAGGMGEVWKARDTRLDRLVALKTSREAFNDRFLREAKTIARLDHPHICTLYDVGPDFLVMELLDGKPLQGPLPLKIAITYAIQICSALSDAHHLGIVHRDLKPANILVTRKGIVLLDFGLAKVDNILEWDTESAIESTRPGQILGTLHYMSPEQLQGRVVDARSDIFSLGLVFYEMFTGKRAVNGGDPASVISEILRGEAPRLDALKLELPPALEGLVARCLEKDPEARWQSVRDIQWVLESIESAPESRLSFPTREGSSWKGAATVGISVALLSAVLAAGGWWWMKSRPADIPEWRLRPLTAYSGIESMPALSGDGKLVAFVWDGDHGDNFDIYVKPIGDETPPLRITRDPAEESAPAWSPDGNRLAFLRKTPSGVNLVVSSSHGGGERTMASFPSTPSTENEFGGTLSWSPDGRFVAVASGPVMKVDMETREVKQLSSKLPASTYDSMPAYSPDGASIAYARGAYANARILHVQKLDRDGNASGEPTALTNVSQGLIGITWWPERDSLITAVGYPGSFMEPIWISVKGGTPRYFPLDGTAVWYPNYNQAQHRLVYQRQWLDQNLLRASLHSPTAAPQAVVASTHMDLAVEVSPDGEHIAFISTRTGKTGIWRADRDGGNQMLLASLAEEPVGSPRFTPDGKSIIFDAGRAGVSGLYLVSSEGGIPAKIPANGVLVRPSVSPDGKWIYYTNSATGRRELYRMPNGGGEQVQFTKEGGTDARPSSDGSTVFYFRDSVVRRKPAKGGDEQTIASGITRNHWTVSGNKVYVIREKGEHSVVLEVASDGGSEKVVYEVPFRLVGNSSVSGIAVSERTGDIFLQQQARLESDLMIVENFR